ncbi:DUF936 domain-containing protein [Quillaja saponaria]|uniref:DUF936 domain-containing protein n=1 Tax=Quillaja saponaria TaxID=32244 RepID=A0AAD7L0P1_QUISA|nr:DUF936 domain-containing protein [Quillaja saponaria]
MASLTPGVLLKLLQNAGNKDVKVIGEHRSALLQVIEILPSIARGDDPWQSRGFFLKVSDSMHSAYVSISEEDIDLIYSDKIQLGQFVYVSRLDLGSHVHVLRGLKPVPKRRPCIGNPVDLVSSDSLPIRANLDFRKPRKGNKNNTTRAEIVKVSAKEKAKTLMAGEVENSKIDVSAVNNTRVQVDSLDVRRLSLDSARRAWDQSPTPRSTTRTTTSRLSKPSSTLSYSASAISEKKASRKNDSSSGKSLSFCSSPLKNKNENFPHKVTSTPSKKDFKPSCEGSTPSCLVKVPLDFKTWPDQSISWNDLLPTICNLGKQVACHRNDAFLAAVRSIEEAYAADSVIQCISTFAELCQSSDTVSAGIMVEQFLDFHQNLQRASTLVRSLLTTRPPETKQRSCPRLQDLLADVCRTSTDKNAISWVQAAIGTNLSKFNLFRTQSKGEILEGQKCHCVVIENASEELIAENDSTKNKRSPGIQRSSLPNSSAKRVPSTAKQCSSAAKNMSNDKEEFPKRFSSAAKNKGNDKEEFPKGSRLQETASLADKLFLVSREWFLKYLEDSLRVGFGLRNEEGKTQISRLLGQLKRVNLWLENLVGSGDMVDDRVENLRKMLYGFLLEHVNSAIASSKWI